MTIKILRATSNVRMQYIDKIKGSIGSREFSNSYELDESVGVIDIYGYEDDSSSEKTSITIYFKIPSHAPNLEDMRELFNKVLGTNNEYGNLVLFHTEFYAMTIQDLMELFFEKLALPRINEEDYNRFTLNALDINKNKFFLVNLSPYGKKDTSPPFDVIKDYHLDIEKRILYVRTDASYNKFEANVDHEKFFNHFVKDENIIKHVYDAFPSIKNLK